MPEHVHVCTRERQWRLDMMVASTMSPARSSNTAGATPAVISNNDKPREKHRLEGLHRAALSYATIAPH